MRFKQISVAGLMVATFLTGQLWAADKYEIDPSHSEIQFSVKHMLLSNVKGNFTDFSGVIMFDEKDLTQSSVDVTIKSASITTDNQKRDDHLRSADFFDAEKFPTLTFKSKKVTKKSDTEFEMTGDFTMHGLTKEVMIPFTYNGQVMAWGNSRIGAEGSLTVNRQDYGVSWSKKLDNGGLVVGDDVKIDLTIEAAKFKPEEPKKDEPKKDEPKKN